MVYDVWTWAEVLSTESLITLSILLVLFWTVNRVIALSNLKGIKDLLNEKKAIKKQKKKQS